MSLLTIILICFGAISIWMLLNPLTKKRNQDVKPPLKSQEQITLTEEPNQFDQPVDADPVDGEMPIKPVPVNCQKAQFMPAPEKFVYTDCCGQVQEGEGYQPWEKRSPVSIDANQKFLGMELLGEEATIDC